VVLFSVEVVIVVPMGEGKPWRGDEEEEESFDGL